MDITYSQRNEHNEIDAMYHARKSKLVNGWSQKSDIWASIQEEEPLFICRCSEAIADLVD